MYLEHAKKQFGLWLQSQREESGVKRSTVARTIGYRNLNKGCRRILSWEQGKTDIPQEHVEAIKELFSIDEQTWQTQRDILNVAHEQHRVFNNAQVVIRNQTQQLLADYCDFLLENLAQISEIPSWRHIQLHGLNFGMMYIGGNTSVQLGGLLQAWSEGRLIAQTDDGPVWIFSGGCSPLSGWNTLDGFNYRTRICRGYRNLFRPASREIGVMIKHCRDTSMGLSNWSLPQLLSQLGVPTEPANLKLKGEEWGRYDFKTGELTFGAETICFPVLASDSHTFHRTGFGVETSWEKSKGRRVVIGDLLTGQQGIYRGEQWVVENRSGCWVLKPGVLYRPDGYPVLSWDSDIPPMVQVWLIENKSTLFQESASV